MAPQKVEVGGPSSFDGLTDTRDIIDELLKYALNPYHVVTEKDRDTAHERPALPSPVAPHLNG